MKSGERRGKECSDAHLSSFYLGIREVRCDRCNSTSSSSSSWHSGGRRTLGWKHRRGCWGYNRAASEISKTAEFSGATKQIHSRRGVLTALTTPGPESSEWDLMWRWLRGSAVRHFPTKNDTRADALTDCWGGERDNTHQRQVWRVWGAVAN